MIRNLNLVRNYMLGAMLGSLEKCVFPMQISLKMYISRVWIIIPITTITSKSVKIISAEQLKELANRYLNISDFTKVVVGKNS